MAAKYSRVLVHLRKTSQNVYETAKFTECIFDHLGIEDDGFVECQLENNQLLIQAPTQDIYAVKSLKSNHRPNLYRIMHPPFCPVHHLDDESMKSLPPEILSRGIDVGVAVLLESSDGHLLLTRRAPHMRTFPGVWVPPGGHIEEGETLEDAALRELKEETGLSISSAERKGSNILGLWESVYPPILAMGPPKRHHIVVYLHIITSHSAKDLTSCLKLCPEEVDAAVWLSPDLVNIAVWNPDGKDSKDEETCVRSDDSKEIHITLVNKFGEHASGVLDSNILRNRVPTPGLDIERISTGSRYALSLWLEKQLTGSKQEVRNLYDKNIFLEKNSNEKLRNKI
ncbi:nucleoside diphosphate-linked moiety X motif 17-like [Palaemon carinicauda]|uniref:nucleoside diphosphate-linked moiety X motif 17-like n=1 Tax=Palaemon carinicauda TaxID=392227 RepID=UPI0035B6723B